MDPNHFKQIVEKAQNQEPEAFGQLVEQTRRFAFGTVYRITGNVEETRDILQDAYLRVWQHIGRYNGKVPFRSWFFSILRNLAIDWVRRQRRINPVPPPSVEGNDTDHPAGLLESKELNELIARWLPTLPKTQHLVFLLRDIDDLSIREVMEQTGLTEPSVKSNLYVARKKLAAYLKTKGYTRP
jgi:RNA polymerase sigma-70 factor (ECF subfamily)